MLTERLHQRQAEKAELETQALRKILCKKESKQIRKQILN